MKGVLPPSFMICFIFFGGGASVHKRKKLVQLTKINNIYNIQLEASYKFRVFHSFPVLFLLSKCYLEIHIFTRNPLPLWTKLLCATQKIQQMNEIVTDLSYISKLFFRKQFRERHFIWHLTSKSLKSSNRGKSTWFRQIERVFSSILFLVAFPVTKVKN